MRFHLGQAAARSNQLLGNLLTNDGLVLQLGDNPLLLRLAKWHTRYNRLWYALGIVPMLVFIFGFWWPFIYTLYAMAMLAAVFCWWSAERTWDSRIGDVMLSEMPLPVTPRELYVSAMAGPFRVATLLGLIYFGIWLWIGSLIGTTYLLDEISWMSGTLTWSLVLPSSVLLSGALGMRCRTGLTRVFAGVGSLALALLLIPASYWFVWLILGLTREPWYWRNLCFVAPLWAEFLLLRAGPMLALSGNAELDSQSD